MEKRKFNVFLSHNNADKPAVEAIARKLVKEGIEPWLDKWNLIPGEPWHEAIVDALNSCESCAVFIGPSGIGPWQNEEMRAAIDRRVRESQGRFRVIPVLLPGSKRDERSRLPTFLVATAWVEFRHTVDDKESFRRLLCGIKGLEPGPEPGQAFYEGTCPYRGLQFFDVEHASFFFGREALTGWLLNEIHPSSNLLKDNRFLGIIGPSGSGKSSLARAGLLAALKRGEIERSENWSIVICRPGASPLENIAVALSHILGNVKTPSQIRSLLKDLRNDERTLHLTIRLAQPEKPPEWRLTVLLDQFEEVFTLCHDEQLRRALIDNLVYASGVANGKMLVLLTLRTDYYGKCALYPKLAAALSDHQVLIGPMTEDELRHAIERPAVLAGCKFESGLVELLLGEVLGQPGGLPLLQHALLELWQRREGRQLTLKAYKAIGGVAGALERRAEKIYNQLSEPEKSICRRVFLRLTQPGEGAEDTKRRVSKQELIPVEGKNEMIDTVIQKLASAEARLITTEGESKLNGEQFIEVAHEVLIRGWSRLREWIEIDRAALRTHRKLTEAANEWYKKAKDESFLYRGARLAEAEEWAKTHNEDLNELELTFLQASVKLRDKELLEAEAQRKRELEAAQKLAEEAEARRRIEAEAATRLRKRAVILTGLGVIASVLAIVAIIFLGIANRARGNAEYQSKIAHAREVLAIAEAQVGVNVECGLSLALHAYDLAREISDIDMFPFNNALHNAIIKSRVQTTIGGFKKTGGSLDWSPDGKTIAATKNDSTVSILNIEVEQGAISFRVNNPQSLDWHPDNQKLAIIAADTTIKIWSNISSQIIESLRIISFGPGLFSATKVSWSPDGQRLAAIYFSDIVNLWEVEGEVYTPKLPYLGKGGITDFSWSPDGKQIAFANRDHTVKVWNVVKGKIIGVLTGHTANVHAVSWSPDGKWLASGSDEGLVYLWDAKKLDRIAIFPGHTNQVIRLAWSPDGALLASASWDATIRLWNIKSRKMMDILTGHTSGILGLGWRPDGKQLASFSQDGTIRIWNLNPSRSSVVLQKGEGWMWDTSWSSDGRLIASASDENTIMLWDYQTDQKYRDLVGHNSQVTKVAWSPDGQFLASTSQDETIRIWDVNTGEELKMLSGNHGIIYDISWSPNGKQLASANYYDGSVRLWDVETGENTLALLGVSSPSVAWSPDGKFLGFTHVTAGTVILWDTEAKKSEPTELKGHTERLNIWGLAWSPDGTLLASASDDNTVRIWDTKTNECLKILTGHTSDVKGVAWSSDGKQLATASLDKTIRLWDTDTWLSTAILTGHTSGVRSVSWHPHGRQLVSAGEDGTVRLFFTDMEDVLEIVRTQVTRGLTIEENKSCLEHVSSPTMQHDMTFKL